MISKKNILALLLVLCMLTGMLAGCGVKDGTDEANTLTINMWSSVAAQMRRALEAEFPDIHFVIHEYTGANSSWYHKELLQCGEGGDIFLYTTFYNDNDAPEYLVDLSGYPFLSHYDKAILSALDVKGAIYQIPGPISVRYVAVNKTLFEERGWKIPENFDEMVAVCKQIREEAPEITPLGLGAEGRGFVWTLVTSYAQMGYLDTAEGRMAEQRYRAGTASFGDAFGEGLDMVSRLVDAGAFLPDKFGSTWDIRPEQMGNREAAMCYVMGSSERHARLFSGEAKGDPAFGVYNNDEYVIRPLYGMNPKNKGLILGTSNTWGINKRLEEKGNEKKLANALRVLAYVSSEEGQLAIRSDPADIPAIKDLHDVDIPTFMQELWNDSTNSIKTFFLYTGYEHMMIETGEILHQAMQKGDATGMKEEFIRLADQLNKEFLLNQASSAAFGYAEENLSVEQTRRVSCEAFRATGGTDIALASEAGIKNGIENINGLSGRLFRGDITTESLNVILARKGAEVVTVSLTGREVRTMLEQGKYIPRADGTGERFTYWAGGLEIKRQGARITMFTPGGKPLEDSAHYTVAMLSADYSEEFASTHTITNTGVSITDSLAAYFASQGVIKAKG